MPQNQQKTETIGAGPFAAFPRNLVASSSCDQCPEPTGVNTDPVHLAHCHP